MPMNSKELGALTKFFKTTIELKITDDNEEEEDDDNDEEKQQQQQNEKKIKERENEAFRINTQEFLIYFNKIQREEQSKRHTERIENERYLIKKKKEYKILLKIQKEREELESLLFNQNDEITFLEKMKKATQMFNADSSLFIESLQGFKGPSLPPGSFRDIFNRIFLMKLSLPEVGVLLSILDLGGTGLYLLYYIFIY